MSPQYLKVLHWSAVHHYAALLLGWQKSFKSNIFTLLCLSGLNSARQCQNNWTDQSNQSRRGLAFTDAERAAKIENIERERGKMEAAIHLMFSQLFYERNVKWPTVIFNEANYSNFFSQICPFWEREREMKCVMNCACVNYLHLFVCPYKQWNWI